MTASITRGRQRSGDERLGLSSCGARPMSRRRAVLLAVAAALLVALVLTLMLVTQVARADGSVAAQQADGIGGSVAAQQADGIDGDVATQRAAVVGVAPRTPRVVRDTLSQVTTRAALAAGGVDGAHQLRQAPPKGVIDLVTHTGLGRETAVLDGCVC